MKNNVYIRSETSIKTISLTRIFLLIPLIIYGCYKNGLYLYMHKYVNLMNMFRPLILIITGALIGALVNIIYELIIKKRKSSLSDTIFSSFHVEYGIILACVSSVNTNIFVFALLAFFMFLISKFFNNRLNIVCLTFIAIYSIMMLEGGYIYANVYELSKTFSFSILDYLTGRAIGGIASTHIILIIVALACLHISNANKSDATIYACLTYGVVAIIYAVVTKINILDMLFLNNYLFIFTFVATDSVTSCYTNNGKKVYGILIGLTTILLYRVNPILAPFISITIISLLNNLIDRLVGIKHLERTI